MSKALRAMSIILISCGFSACQPICWVEPQDVPSDALSEAIFEAVSDSAFDVVDEIPEDWWAIFEDEQLADCIERALNCHPSAHAAYLQIMASKYRADLMKSHLNPTVTAVGSITKQQLSETSLVPFGPSFVSPNDVPLNFTEYDLHLNLLYDLDLWGKKRHMVTAALGDMYSRMADQHVARLNLSLAVADTYFKLQIAYKREELASRLVECRKASLALVDQRANSGIDSCFLLTSAQNGLSQAEQLLLQVNREVKIYEHQLQAYVTGDFGEYFPNIEITHKPPPHVPLPADLPLHLISRRADIQSQLWLIEAARYQICAAKARFYPDINLLGLVGLQTIHSHEWFDGDSLYYTFGPAISLPLYDPNAGIANLRGKEVDYDLAVTQYNQLVLNAAKEVLDGITNVQSTAQQLKHSQYQSENIRKSLECASVRLENNLASRIDVLTVEERAILAGDQEAVTYGNALQAILSLIKALGGGYHAECEGVM